MFDYCVLGNALLNNHCCNLFNVYVSHAKGRFWLDKLVYYRPRTIVCGKVMFSVACVKNSVHRGRGRCTPPAG